VLTQEAYRRSLKKKLDGYRDDRKDAADELQRAQVRLQDVDIELSQLDAEAESAKDRVGVSESTEER
jgi:t-SNARE complex subunit (syntaxin)